MILRYILAGLALVSWVVNALYCYKILKRAWAIPYLEEDEIAARFSRRRKAMDMAKLRQDLPRLETMAPGLRYTALVPLAIAGTFALNGLSRIFLFKDGTAWIWFSVALMFLPVTMTVFLVAYEQTLLITRLHELVHGPSGMRLSELRRRKEEAEKENAGPPQESTGMHS